MCNQTLASAQTHLQCVAANPNTPEPHTLPPLEKGDSRNAGIKSALVKTGEMWNKIIRGSLFLRAVRSEHTIISAPGGDYKARDKENDGDYPLQLESGSH